MSIAGNEPLMEGKMQNCIDVASEELLRCYINNDDHVMLVGDAFKIPVKLSVINCFLPVMKKGLQHIHPHCSVHVRSEFLILTILPCNDFARIFVLESSPNYVAE